MGNSSDNPIDIADPFARQLMARYLERRGSDVEKLRSALDAGDFETIRTTGHNLYGSGATYGLAQISDLGKRIEAAAEARDTSAIGALIAELERFLGALNLR